MADSESTALGKDLAQTPLANVLIAALKQKATGQLTIRYSAGEDRIFFSAGIPSGSQMPDPVRRLGRMLLQLGWISDDQLNRSIEEKLAGERQGEALVKIGALTAEKLSEALQVQLIRNLVEIAKLPAGELTFEAIREAPPWAAGVSSSRFQCVSRSSRNSERTCRSSSRHISSPPARISSSTPPSKSRCACSKRRSPSSSSLPAASFRKDGPGRWPPS
jgi:hypothetical protein